MGDGKEIYLFDIASMIREDTNVLDAIVFSIPLADGSNSLLAHIIFEPNFYGDKSKELELIDAYLNVAFDGEVVIDGFKEHDKAFVISPTTAKVDRNSMYHDRTQFTKVVNGEEYNVDLIDTSKGLLKSTERRENKDIKTLKKQI